jgi:phosphoglycerate dehydrogenase-like enzyme
MPVPTVLVTSRFLFERRESWRENYGLIGPEDLALGIAPGLLDGVEVLVSDGEFLDPALLAQLPALKLVACFSTGYSGIDVAALRARGIALTAAGGINAHDVADHALALLLAWWHRIPQADRAVREGSWRQGLLPRPSLKGRKLGIVGLGRIGAEIARRADSFGLQVSWWGPNAKPQERYPRAASLVHLAQASDILVIAMRAIPANTGQINRAVLHALGSEGLLINVSRGFLIDEAALIDALRSATIAGAALDVLAPEPPDMRRWTGVSNVLFSPHIAGYTREGGDALFGQLKENIRRQLAGAPLLSPVEGPL